MSNTYSTLLIHRADLPSLATIALESDPGSLAIWTRRMDGPRSLPCLNLIRKHAEILRTRLTVDDYRKATDGAEVVPPLLTAATDLMDAVFTAVQMGIDRVIWPVHTGPDVDELSRVARIAVEVVTWTEWSTRRGVTIDTPVAELTNRQLLEIVEDAGIPLWLFWPCERDGADPCTICPSCRRWLLECEDAGFGWPWASADASETSRD